METFYPTTRLLCILSTIRQIFPDKIARWAFWKWEGCSNQIYPTLFLLYCVDPERPHVLGPGCTLAGQWCVEIKRVTPAITCSWFSYARHHNKGRSSHSGINTVTAIMVMRTLTVSLCWLLTACQIWALQSVLLNPYHLHIGAATVSILKVNRQGVVGCNMDSVWEAWVSALCLLTVTTDLWLLSGLRSSAHIVTTLFLSRAAFCLLEHTWVG